MGNIQGNESLEAGLSNAAMSQTPKTDKRLLNPIERISEIIFGLIMALTFTGTISIINSDRNEVRDLLVGAVGCNIAWGLVDAVMYLLGVLTERGRGRTILQYIRNTNDAAKSREFIAEALPPIVASALKTEGLELARQGLIKIPESSLRVRLTTEDFKRALGIFLLVFFSTFPIVIPFIFVEKLELALRLSNLVAILLMFISGWLLAGYGGYNKWITGLALTLLGVALVFLTIALGG